MVVIISIIYPIGALYHSSYHLIWNSCQFVKFVSDFRFLNVLRVPVDCTIYPIQPTCGWYSTANMV